MAFDFKKEYKEFYLPDKKPGIVMVPKMNYLAVRGQGDPNKEDGEYKQAIGLLYGIAFTIKMSKKGDHQIDGYSDHITIEESIRERFFDAIENTINRHGGSVSIFDTIDLQMARKP